MEREIRKSNTKPAVTLFFLAPIIAELLFGSTPVSRAYLLIIESLFYGSSVLLIREFARRRNLGWYSIIILGIASGILEECLLLQSAFNPAFLKLDMAFGRSLGVNWVWAESIIGYHAIWSTTIPIVFAELLYPSRSNQPWLRKSGLILMSSILLLSCVIYFTVFYKMSGYIASPAHFIVALLIVILLPILSIRIPVNKLLSAVVKTSPQFVIILIAFIAAVLWLIQIILVFTKASDIPAGLVILTGFLIASLTFFIIKKYVNGSKFEAQRFSLASGALLASMLFGLLVLTGSGNVVDEYSQVAFIVISVLLLVRLRMFISKRNLKSSLTTE